MSSPRNDITCATFTIIISYLTFCYMLFLLLNFLTKFVCVFYSTYQEMVQDSKVIKTMWIFVIVASTTFVPLEFIFAHDIQSMNTYKELKVSGILNRNFSLPLPRKNIDVWFLIFQNSSIGMQNKKMDIFWGTFLYWLWFLTFT